MQLSDCIELTGVIVALVVGIISIVISVNTLKQNSKMIEESTRPYVVVYLETTHLCDQEWYFIIKNFGNSGACITKFEYNKEIDSIEFTYPDIQAQLRTIHGLFLAPQQKVLIAIGTIPKELKFANFIIGYRSEAKYYEESYRIDTSALAQHISTRTDENINFKVSEIKLPKIVTYGIQEFIERKL